MTPPESPREGPGREREESLMASTDINNPGEQKQREQGRLEKQRDRAL